MTVLQPNEYDASYFDGKSQSLRHNAGYHSYERHYRQDPGSFPDNDQHFGNSFKDIAYTYFYKYDLAGKKVLDLGCAKGFVVKDLRDFGADAYGVDVSQYAIDSAEDGMAPYLTVADVRTHLKNYSAKEFDLVISRRLFECLPEEDIPTLIKEINRITVKQDHVIEQTPNSLYYNVADKQSWTDTYSWKKGSVIAPLENEKQSVTK